MKNGSIPAGKTKAPIEIAKSVEQQNKIYRRQEQKNEPFFVIRKLRKYGWVEYDFLASSFRLKDEARERIKKIWETFTAERLQQWDTVFKNRAIFYSFGRSYGMSAIMVMHECQNFAGKVQPIVSDKKNWVDYTISERLKKFTG